jgi:GT2 family glycosyltransferase
MTARPAVTIVVVPRERFSCTRETLETLYAATAPPFALVYVDGGSPPAIRDYVRAQAAARGFTLLRRDAYMTAESARNLGFAEVRTPYVLFLDNDVLVAPGWLDAMLACAEETGSAIVGPLYCADRPAHTTVHMAGGRAHVEERDGARYLIEEHLLMHRPLADVRPALRRGPVEQVEFHCLLMRSDVARALSPFDERFCGVPEAQIDLCLEVRARGGAVMLEPAAIVTYDRPLRLQWSDVPFYLWRWNVHSGRRGLDHFRRKWRLADDDPYFARQLAFMAWQRHRALRTFWPLWPALRVVGRARRFRAAEGISAAVAQLAARHSAASRERMRSASPTDHA